MTRKVYRLRISSRRYAMRSPTFGRAQGVAEEESRWPGEGRAPELVNRRERPLAVAAAERDQGQDDVTLPKPFNDGAAAKKGRELCTA